MTGANVEYLREHGPATLEELPTVAVTVGDRMDGVWEFYPAGCNSPADPTGDQVTPVYYLEGEHDREAVIQTFLDVNSRVVEAKTRQGLRGILRRQGRQWHDAIDAVYPQGSDADDGGR